ncbi:acyl carrier protein [Brevibacillus fulvus]|uniref:Acyl carrier protein n=1 Tax=Brevibacillus fulvus TaxID=1125967 RepID=A0A938XSG3_9BACL|nr:phosphopantetheine-binding protein [Brevibacillus fulvus]MBM7589553.1 acyl carrier protein [Brevibacillus fulvus]
MTQEQVYELIKGALVEAIGVDEEEIGPEKTLLGDLGAESLDLLDVLFRISRKTGVKVTMDDITAMIQGEVPDEDFETADGLLSDKGLEQLKRSLPQIDVESLRGKFEADRVLTLFTVDNLTNLVVQSISVKAS